MWKCWIFLHCHLPVISPNYCRAIGHVTRKPSHTNIVCKYSVTGRNFCRRAIAAVIPLLSLLLTFRPCSLSSLSLPLLLCKFRAVSHGPAQSRGERGRRTEGRVNMQPLSDFLHPQIHFRLSSFCFLRKCRFSCFLFCLTFPFFSYFLLAMASFDRNTLDNFFFLCFARVSQEVNVGSLRTGWWQGRCEAVRNKLW